MQVFFESMHACRSRMSATFNEITLTCMRQKEVVTDLSHRVRGIDGHTQLAGVSHTRA